MLKKVELSYIVSLLIGTMILFSISNYYYIEGSIYGWHTTAISKEIVLGIANIYIGFKYITIVALIIGFFKIMGYEKKLLLITIGKFIFVIVVSLIITVVAQVIMENNIPSAQYAKVAPMIMYMEIPKYLPIITTISMVMLFLFTKNIVLHEFGD